MAVAPDDVARGVPLASQVAMVREALACSGEGPRVVFGHSFGGLVALLAMLEGTPVDAAVLYEPIALAVLDDANVRDRNARAWDRALVDHLAERIGAGDPEGGVRRFIEAYNEVAWPSLPERARTAIIADAPAICDLTQVVHHLPLPMDRLRTLATRTLVMSGTRSPLVTRRMAARLASLLPNAAASVVRDAGHMAPVLLPEAVAELVVAFVTHALDGGSLATDR
jgi:pimeloyl-ACP methyl ester carboxylesterase